MDKIVAFWKQYGYYDVDESILRGLIEKHLGYNTLLVETVGEEIVAICRFNIEENNTCNCLDVVIHPSYRHKNLLKLLIIRGLHRFPYVTKLKFERGLRNQEHRTYDIYKFLGLKLQEATNG